MIRHVKKFCPECLQIFLTDLLSLDVSVKGHPDGANKKMFQIFRFRKVNIETFVFHNIPTRYINILQ